MKHHNRYEAKKYAPRVTPEQRVKAFVLVGCVSSAPAWGQVGERGGSSGCLGQGCSQEQLSPCAARLGAWGPQGETGVYETPQEHVGSTQGAPWALPSAGGCMGCLPLLGLVPPGRGGTAAGAAVPTPPPAPPLCCRDLDQAADAAIEHKNETEMNFVLSKCTASTDTAVVEKLNRARAQLLKK